MGGRGGPGPRLLLVHSVAVVAEGTGKVAAPWCWQSGGSFGRRSCGALLGAPPGRPPESVPSVRSGVLRIFSTFNRSLPAPTGQRGLRFLQLRALTHRGACCDDAITPLGGSGRGDARTLRGWRGEDPDQEIPHVLLRGLQPTSMSPGSSLFSPSPYSHLSHG